MFCSVCGNQVADNTNVCTRCGNALPRMQVQPQAPMQGQVPAQPQVPVQPQAPNQKAVQLQKNTGAPLVSKKRKLWLIPVIAGGSFLLIVLGIVAAIFIVINAYDKNYSNRIEAGRAYLKDLDYQEAIATFKNAISIRPNEPDAYLGLAEVYAAMAEDCADEGEYSEAMNYYLEAIDVILDGIDKCEDNSKLEKKRKKYNERYNELDELYRKTETAGDTDNIDIDNSGNVSGGDAIVEPVEEIDLISEFCKRATGLWISDNYFVEIGEGSSITDGIFFSGVWTSYEITGVELSENIYTVCQYYNIEANAMNDAAEGTISVTYYSDDNYTNNLYINGTRYIRMVEPETGWLSPDELQRDYKKQLSIVSGAVYTIIAYCDYVYGVDQYVNVGISCPSASSFYNMYQERIDNRNTIIMLCEDSTYKIDEIADISNSDLHFEIYYYGTLIASSADDWHHKYVRGATGIWYYTFDLDHGNIY